jgi:hypothetical protein
MEHTPLTENLMLDAGEAGATRGARRVAGDRRGVALVTALFGMVVLAIIISGVFFTSTQEYRGARNELVEQRSFAVAEFGLNSAISNWDRSRNIPGAFATGAIDSSQIFVASGDTARVKVTRLNDNSFWVVSEGQANMGSAKLLARRQSAAYVRIAYPSIKPKGAITAAGDVSLSGSALINGNNTDPAGWDQCAGIPGSTVPGVVVPPGDTVKYLPQNIVSTPPVAYDPAAGDSNTYVRYGTESWKSLVANADIKLPGGQYGQDILPVGTATTCDVSQPLNWGEPSRPGDVAGCYSYFPIIYSDGSLKINGNGRGQGILLINGDLEINGTFSFYGLIIVRDDVNKGNGDATVFGSILAANVNLGDPSVFNGNKDVFYSKCAVESVLRGSAILTRVTQRGWAQIY